MTRRSGPKAAPSTKHAEHIALIRLTARALRDHRIALAEVRRTRATRDRLLNEMERYQ